MPQAVGAAVAKFVGIALGTVAASGVTTFLVKATFAVGLSILSSKLFAPKIPESQAGLTAKSTTVRSTLEYRKVVYGEAVVSGPIVYHNLQGTNGEHAWYVIALCDGISESIESLWLDGSEIPASDINWTPSATGNGGTGNGNVSTAAWVGDNSTPAVQAYWALGDPDQVDLNVINTAFSDWGTNHRGRGITYGAVAFLYDEDTEEIWNEFGQPNDIKFQVKGRQCYDRRKDALNSDPDFATVGKPVGEGLRWFGNFAKTLTLNSDFSVASGVLTLNSSANRDAHSERIPVDTSKRYVVTVTGQEISGTETQYLGVIFYDANGDNIEASTDTATGWRSKGTYFYFGRANERFAASATEYTLDFGVGGTAQFPQDTTAVTMSIVWLGNFSGGTAVNNIRDAAIHEYVATRHDFSDSSTWEWSDNPSVCLADYMTQIVGAGYAKIDWDAMIVAAQACDETVTIPTASTETRFTCNGALSMGISHKDNINDILSSMFGRFTWKQGKWTWTAGVWTDPEVTIDGDWLTESDVEVQGSSATRDRYNTVRGFYVDPNRKYESVEFAPVSDAAYVTRDNSKVLEFDLELPMTNSEFMAQRIAYRVLEQGDNQAVVSMTLNEKAAQLAIGDRVTVDLWPIGWTAGGNLLTYSEDLSQSAWTKTNVTISTNAIAGPFGTVTADKIEEDTATGQHQVYHSVSVSSGQVYTYAVWLKADEDTMARMILFNATTFPGNPQAVFNLSAGTITSQTGSIIAAHMLPYPDGWYRCIIIAEAQAAGTVQPHISLNSGNSYAGTTGDGFYVYGAQLIAGHYESPYYSKTTAAAVTTTAKSMRVIKWTPNLDGTHEVVLKEDDEASYDDPAEGDYTDLTAGTITVPSSVVPPPSGLTAQSVPYGVKLSWTNPASSTFDFIEVYASSTSAWSGAVRIASVRTSTYTHNLASGETRYYWIRARRDTLVSTRDPDSDTSTITASSSGDAEPVTLLGATLDDVSITPTDASVGYRLNSSGEEDTYQGSGASYSSIGTWLIEGAAGDYDCRLTVNSGTSPTGASTGTWLDLGTTRAWSLTDTSSTGSAITNNCTIEIRDGTSLAVLASATVNMSVEETA